MNIEHLRQDWYRNSGSIKSLIIIMSYRISSWVAQNNLLIIRISGIPIRILYKIFIEFILGVELPDKVRAGPGLAVFHGVGLVVNAETVLGSNVTLRQNTTIGTKRIGSRAPIIGDNVSIGVNVVIIGDINIGEGSVIGAGAVLVESCPPGSVVYATKALVVPRDTKES